MSSFPQSFPVGFCLFFFVKFYFILFLYLAVLSLRSLVAASGGYSLVAGLRLLAAWPLLLQSTGSRYMGFRSCGSWA